MVRYTAPRVATFTPYPAPCGAVRRRPVIPREQFPRSILVANIMRMSLTCHEEIWRVGLVGRADEDASRLLATFRPSQHEIIWQLLTCPQQIVRVGLAESGKRQIQLEGLGERDIFITIVF